MRRTVSRYDKDGWSYVELITMGGRVGWTLRQRRGQFQETMGTPEAMVRWTSINEQHFTRKVETWTQTAQL